MESILIYTNKKETQVKTFSPTIYLLLGLFLAGLGVYYFTTQFREDRIEEWLPLGISLLLGIYLIIGHRAGWKRPGSKYSFYKHDFLYHPETRELLIIFSSNRIRRRIDQRIDLSDTTQVQLTSKAKSSQRSETTLEHDPMKILPMGQATPTGSYTTTSTVNYRHQLTFLKKFPSEEEIQLKFSPKMSATFEEKLNELLSAK
ncbi:MAG: hypothetical protein EP338_01645 [Bacteroidetes bacterium]|nr:MAG: hypothetical protein EP338_01645 [Bacteroidota bacterium]